MTKLVLHIGAEKTGTTSIQALLADNAETLTRNGVRLPSNFGGYNSRRLPAACSSLAEDGAFLASVGVDTDESFARFRSKTLRSFERFVAGLPSDVTVLVSSEHFHSRLQSEATVANTRWLTDLFDEVEIVFYVRAQADMCESLYSTALRAGSKMPLVEFSLACVSENPYYNHWTSVGRWRDTHPGATLHVDSLERLRAEGRSLLDAFAAAAFGDVDAAQLEFDVARTNQSLSLAGQALARATNRADGLTKADTNRVFGRIEHLTGPGERLPDAVRERIHRDFAGPNSLLAEAFPNTAPMIGSLGSAPRPVDQAGGELLDRALEELIDRVAVAEIHDSYADTLREAAVALRPGRPALSIGLLELALVIRPHGPVIRRMLGELRAEQMSD